MVNDKKGAENISSEEVSWVVILAKWLDRVISNGFLLNGSQGMAWLSGGVMIILTGAVFLDVLGHNTPLRVPWAGATYELAELLMGLISALGLSYCWYNKGHVRIELVIERLSPKVSPIFEMITSILTLIFVGALGWRSMALAIKALERSEQTEIMKLPVGLFMLVFSIVMLHFALVLVRFSLQHLLAIFRSGTEPAKHFRDDRC